MNRRFPIVLTAGLLALVGCDPADPEDSGEPTDTTDSETGDVVGSLEVGFGEEDFTPIHDGGELHVVWGSQGAAMFPMPLRGREFTLAPDPKDYTDERTPELDLELDVDGMEAGVCGNFKCIRNYPITFDVLPDGTYEFIYVRVIMPDDVDPATLDGRTAHLSVTLSPHDSAPLVEEFDLTVRVDPPPF